MCVAGDRHQHAMLCREAASCVVDVQPLRLRVELEMAAAVRAGLNDPLEVDVDGLAFAYQACQGMREDRETGVVDRLQQPAGLPAATQVEMAVDRADDQVQP